MFIDGHNEYFYGFVGEPQRWSMHRALDRRYWHAYLSGMPEERPLGYSLWIADDYGMLQRVS